jgi:phosphoglucosamine mutase
MGLFGTSGIRAVVDSWLVQMALRVGLAVGRLNESVVVGGDTRTSMDAVKHAVIAGLLASGARSYDAGIVPTPTLALAARKFDSGIMVTASHNPPEYNGIKLLNPDGSAFDSYQQREIEEMIASDSLATTTWDRFQSASVYQNAIEKHIEGILADFPETFRLKVALDCGCGAASRVTPELLRRMGCEVIALNCDPSGFFPRSAEPTEANLTERMKAVREFGTALGIAHDGDADRMMVVDGRGSFVPGDKLLVLLARELRAKRVVTTIDASMAVGEDGFDVVRTGVGDNNVSEELKKGGDFGGEPSGAWIFPESSLCPDGIYAAALVVSLAGRQKLSSLVDAVPSYPLLRGSVNLNGAVMSELEEKLVTAMKPLSVSRADGIRMGFGDGWLLVRASGTEPKIRVTAEARTESLAHCLYDGAVRLIQDSTARGKEG